MTKQSSLPGDAVSRILVPWLCLSAAAAFVIWIVGSTPGELVQMETGLRSYLAALPMGAGAAAVICAILGFGMGRQGSLRLLGYVSCLWYLSFLKVLSWPFAPWVLLAATVLLFVGSWLREPRANLSSALLVLHAQGTMAGLYLTFNLQQFLLGWSDFKAVVSALRRLFVALAQ